MSAKYIRVDVSNLSDRHIKALKHFIAKFRKGALEHGDLAPGKDWTPDMIDEMSDFGFYLTFQLLDIMETRNGRRK